MQPAAIWDFPPSVTDPTTPIDYRVNVPKLTQVVTRKHFHYFKIRLYDISRFFQKKKSWNHDYPAAQQIYSDGPTSAALRAAIYTEHTILYSSRPWRFGNEEGTLLRTNTAFFELLQNYSDSPISRTLNELIKPASTNPAKSPKKLKIYTYVLMDDSLRFSRTDARMSVDMSSKHALHAGAAPEVFYAGEFWVDFNNDGQRVLFIDNNSGTFAPGKEDLHRMKFLMQTNFPGMEIAVLDYQDPEWKRRRGKEDTS